MEGKQGEKGATGPEGPRGERGANAADSFIFGKSLTLHHKLNNFYSIFYYSFGYFSFRRLQFFHVFVIFIMTHVIIIIVAYTISCSH